LDDPIIILNEGFFKLIRPRDISESVPLGETWDPYLTDFLETASLNIRYDYTFYPDLIDLNRKEVLLTRIYKEFSNRIDLKFRSSASVLVGGVGIGKSSFIRWFRKQAEARKLYISTLDFNQYKLTAYEELRGDELFYSLYNDIIDRFNRYFFNRFQNDSDYKNALSSKIKELRDKAKSKDNKNWEAGFLSQSDWFVDNFPIYDNIWLLSILIIIAILTQLWFFLAHMLL
jgi:hypothetical protein